MRMKFYFLFFIVLKINTSNAQYYIEKEILLPEIKTQNECLLKILDSFLVNEKLCEYYTPKLLISIGILNKRHNENAVTIKSKGNINLVISPNTYGYCYVNNHLVFVKGDKLDVFFNEIEYGKKRTFKYLLKNLNYNGLDRPTLTDGRFSTWSYLFKRDKIIVLWRASFL